MPGAFESGADGADCHEEYYLDNLEESGKKGPPISLAAPSYHSSRGSLNMKKICSLFTVGTFYNLFINNKLQE